VNEAVLLSVIIKTDEEQSTQTAEIYYGIHSSIKLNRCT